MYIFPVGRVGFKQHSPIFNGFNSLRCTINSSTEWTEPIWLELSLKSIWRVSILLSLAPKTLDTHSVVLGSLRLWHVMLATCPKILSVRLLFFMFKSLIVWNDKKHWQLNGHDLSIKLITRSVAKTLTSSRTTFNFWCAGLIEADSFKSWMMILKTHLDSSG